MAERGDVQMKKGLRSLIEDYYFNKLEYESKCQPTNVRKRHLNKVVLKLDAICYDIWTLKELENYVETIAKKHTEAKLLDYIRNNLGQIKNEIGRVEKMQLDETERTEEEGEEEDSPSTEPMAIETVSKGDPMNMGEDTSDELSRKINRWYEFLFPSGDRELGLEGKLDKILNEHEERWGTVKSYFTPGPRNSVPQTVWTYRCRKIEHGITAGLSGATTSDEERRQRDEYVEEAKERVKKTHEEGKRAKKRRKGLEEWTAKRKAKRSGKRGAESELGANTLGNRKRKKVETTDKTESTDKMKIIDEKLSQDAYMKILNTIHRQYNDCKMIKNRTLDARAKEKFDTIIKICFAAELLENVPIPENTAEFSNEIDRLEEEYNVQERAISDVKQNYPNVFTEAPQDIRLLTGDIHGASKDIRLLTGDIHDFFETSEFCDEEAVAAINQLDVNNTLKGAVEYCRKTLDLKGEYTKMQCFNEVIKRYEDAKVNVYTYKMQKEPQEWIKIMEQRLKEYSKVMSWIEEKNIQNLPKPLTPEEEKEVRFRQSFVQLWNHLKASEFHAQDYVSALGEVNEALKRTRKYMVENVDIENPQDKNIPTLVKATTDKHNAIKNEQSKSLAASESLKRMNQFLNEERNSTASKITQMNTIIDQQSGEIKELQHQNEKLLENNKTLNAVKTALQKSVKESTGESDKGLREAKAMVNMIRNKTTTPEDLCGKIIEWGKKIDDQNKEYEELDTTNRKNTNSLTEKMEENTKLNANVKKLTADLEETNKAKRDLEETFDNRLAEETKDLEEKINGLEVELSTTKEELNATNKSWLDLKNKNNELRGQVEKLKNANSDNIHLRQMITNLEGEKKTLENNLNDANKKAENWQKEFDTKVESRTAQLSGTVNQLKDDVDNYQKRIKELQDENKGLQADNESLRANRTEITEDNKRLQKSGERVETLKQENDKVKQELEEVKAEMANDKENYDCVKKQYDTLLDKMKAETEKFSNLQQKFEEEVANRTRDLVEENKDCEKQCESIRDENNNLANNITRLEKANVDLRKENSTQLGRIKELENDLSGNKEKCEQGVKEYQSATAKLEKKRQKIAGLKNTQEELRKTNRELNDNLIRKDEEMKTMANKFETREQEFRDQLDAEKNKVNNMRREVSNLRDTASADVQTFKDDLSKRHKDLEHRIESEFNEKTTHLERENEQLKRENEQLKREMDPQVNKEVARLKEVNQQQATEINELSTRLDDCINTMNDIKIEFPPPDADPPDKEMTDLPDSGSQGPATGSTAEQEEQIFPDISVNDVLASLRRGNNPTQPQAPTEDKSNVERTATTTTATTTNYDVPTEEFSLKLQEQKQLTTAEQNKNAQLASDLEQLKASLATTTAQLESERQTTKDLREQIVNDARGLFGQEYEAPPAATEQRYTPEVAEQTTNQKRNFYLVAATVSNMLQIPISELIYTGYEMEVGNDGAPISHSYLSERLGAGGRQLQSWYTSWNEAAREAGRRRGDPFREAVRNHVQKLNELREKFQQGTTPPNNEIVRRRIDGLIAASRQLPRRIKPEIVTVSQMVPEYTLKFTAMINTALQMTLQNPINAEAAVGAAAGDQTPRTAVALGFIVATAQQLLSRKLTGKQIRLIQTFREQHVGRMANLISPGGSRPLTVDLDERAPPHAPSSSGVPDTPLEPPGAPGADFGSSSNFSNLQRKHAKVSNVYDKMLDNLM